MARQKGCKERNFSWNVSAIYKRGKSEKIVTTKLVSVFVTEKKLHDELLAVIDEIFPKYKKDYVLDEIFIRIDGSQEIVTMMPCSKATNANLTNLINKICSQSNTNGKNRRNQYKASKSSEKKENSNLVDKSKEDIKIRNQNLFKYRDEVKMIDVQSYKPTDSFIIYPSDKHAGNPIDIPNDTKKTRIWTIIAQYADVNTSEIYTIGTVCGIENHEYVHELARKRFPINLGSYTLCQIQIRKYKPSDKDLMWISSPLIEILISPKLLNGNSIKVSKGVSKEQEQKFEMEDFLRDIKKQLSHGFEWEK